jgi:hypothetical protein
MYTYVGMKLNVKRDRLNQKAKVKMKKRLFKHLFTGTMQLTGDPHFLMHYACSTWLPGTAPIIDL